MRIKERLESHEKEGWMLRLFEESQRSRAARGNNDELLGWQIVGYDAEDCGGTMFLRTTRTGNAERIKRFSTLR